MERGQGVFVLFVCVSGRSSEQARGEKMEDKEQEVGFPSYCVKIPDGTFVELLTMASTICYYVQAVDSYSDK